MKTYLQQACLVLTAVFVTLAGWGRAVGAEGDAAVQFPWDGEVKGASVRLRSGSSTRFATVKVLSEHEKLIVVAEDKGWLKVRMPKDVACWIGTIFVKDNGDGTGTVAGKSVNVRISPNTDHYPVGQISAATVALVRDESGKTVTEGEFTRIVAPDQAYAWLGAEFVVRATEAAVEAPAPTGTTEVPAQVPVAEVTPATGDTSPVVHASGPAAEGDVQAFTELDKLFIEQLGKPSAERNFTEIKKLYQQFADFSASEEVKSKSIARVALIEETERKIAEALEAANKPVVAPPEEPAPTPSFLTEGFVADHGREAQVPASHALVDSNGQVLYYIRWDRGDLDRLWQ